MSTVFRRIGTIGASLRQVRGRGLQLLVVGVTVVLFGTVLAVRRDAAIPAGPPEVIVQGFVEALAQHDFEGAMPYLSKAMLAQTIPLTLEVRIDDLERTSGSLAHVRGSAGWTAGPRAYATADADTERGRPVSFGFGLAQDEHGAWRIDELYDLGWKPQGLW